MKPLIVAIMSFLLVACSSLIGAPIDNDLSVFATVVVTETSTPTVSKGPVVQVITSELDLVDFGWLSDGRIYYGVGGYPDIESAEPITDMDETAWYGYDIKNKEAIRIYRPYPGLSADQVRELQHGQSVTLLTMTISPSMEKALYTRMPRGYERPKPLYPHYFDPAEIWTVENLSGVLDEKIERPLLKDEDHLYDCGFAISAESKWFDNETLVLGSCYFTYGIVRVYFLADLLNRTIQFLDFETEAGEYVPNEEIAVAHNSPSLAFRTQDGFWAVFVDDKAREIPLTLTELNFLFDDSPAIAPIWSSDDQWIYYWTLGQPSKYDENGFAIYTSWWLEKINLTTREREIILGEYDLLLLMDYDMYRRSVPVGFGNPWRLSPDEKEILLFINKTVDNEATLFLITLPD